MTGSIDREVAILNAALDFGPAERTAYLDEACAGDTALRKQVEALLQAHDQAEGFLNAPPAGLNFKRTVRGEIPLTEKPGDKIGRYKLLQQIGEGGCGVIYMAEQEEPVRRRVALKVIKLGMDTQQVIARFEAERQALALMDHPNIAKALDAGATETGRPYFVMELVRGIKITDFCDENKLSTERRLRLFIQVCQAVQHAHQKGVIHRDLKPSNILVTINDGVPVPKVIDFGIAKAAQGRLTDQTLFTAFEQFIGTPAYMSPEQAVMTSLDIDTRSDIYSLGVLLYELLTGHTPFDQKELLAAGLDGMRRIIRETEPAKPSTRLTMELTRRGNARVSRAESGVAPEARPPGPVGGGKSQRNEGFGGTPQPTRGTPVLPEHLRTLIHTLRGDLDWIVMKCLEKDRARRYETANGLSRDIERHLDHEPIAARPPTRLYRFQKLIQRNKVTFAALGILALALVLIAGGSTVAAWRVANARRAEQSEREKAQAVNRQLRQTVSLLELEWAEDFFKAQDSAAGVAHLAALLRRDPSNSLAANRLVSALVHRRWAVPGTPPMRHAGAVVLASFSPDGRRVLTASWDKSVCLWDATSGERMAGIRHDDIVSSARFSADGRRFITASADGTARVWETATGAAVTPWLHHSDKVSSAEFSSDGNLVLTASADGSARIWDASSGVLRQELRDDSGGIGLARFSPDGKLVATGTDSGRLCIWSAESGQRLFSIDAHLARINALAWSPDGLRLVSACEDGTARLWNAGTGAPLGEPMVHRLAIWHAALSPDCKWVLTTSEDGTARLWDVRTTRAHGEPMRHESGVTFGDFGPDGRCIITTSSDNTARVWDGQTGMPLLQPLRHIERVLHAGFSPDGRRLVTASYDGTAQVWDLRERCDPGTEIHHDLNAAPFAFSGDGAILLTAARDQTARLWDARNGQPLCEPIPHGSLLSAGDVAPDRRRVALACSDGAVRIWDCGDSGAGPGTLPSPRVITGPFQHGNTVRSVRFNAEGSRIVTASADGTARVWDAIHGQPVSASLVHSGDVLTAQFSRDGRRVVTASEDRTARVWDAQSGEPVTEPLLHADHVHWAEFSPDGESIVTASTDNTACLWHVRTGRQIIPPLRHPRMVGRAVFSPDGRRVATASIDRTARIWDAGTGQALTSPLSHDSFVELVHFTSDGQRLVTACRSGLSRVWDSATGRPLTDWLQAGTYWAARFDPAAERIAMGTVEGMVHLWKIPRAPTPVPEWFPRFAEAVAGIHLGERGIAELVPRSELNQMARTPPLEGSNHFYEHVARWFLTASPERGTPLSP